MSSQTKSYASHAEPRNDESRIRGSLRRTLPTTKELKPVVADEDSASSAESIYEGTVKIRSSLMRHDAQTAGGLTTRHSGNILDSGNILGSSKTVLLLISALFIGLFVSSLLLV